MVVNYQTINLKVQIIFHLKRRFHEENKSRNTEPKVLKHSSGKTVAPLEE